MKEEIKQRIKLIKNGQVPQGYKKTKVGILPEDWEIEKFNSLFDYKKIIAYQEKVLIWNMDI